MTCVAAGPVPLLLLGTRYRLPSRASSFPDPFSGGCSALGGKQGDTVGAVSPQGKAGCWRGDRASGSERSSVVLP